MGRGYTTRSAATADDRFFAKLRAGKAKKSEFNNSARSAQASSIQNSSDRIKSVVRASDTRANNPATSSTTQAHRGGSGTSTDDQGGGRWVTINGNHVFIKD